MNLMHVVGNVRWRLLSLMRSAQIPVILTNAGAPPRDAKLRDADDR
jgi:hypothetical protein